MKLARHIKRQFTTSSTNPKLERISKKVVSINSVKELHAQLIRTRLHKDPFSVSHVIKSYALSESPSYLHKAHLVFNQLERPTLLVFNHMIRGFSQSDQPNKAIDMYNNMYHQGLAGDNLTFIFVFKACARVKDVFHGFAHKVFDQMCNRDLVSWNSLICGYSQCNKFEEVLGLFNSMQEANIKADAVTMVKVILACIYLGNWCTADSMVKYIEENNIEIDVYLGNTLIDMYGRRGLVDLARETFNQMRYKNVVSWNAVIKGYVKVRRLVEAQKLFDMVPRRDVISWTSMITGYSQANQFAEAIKLFREMMFTKVKPDEITVASVLSACAHLGSLDVGEAIHEYVQRHGIKSDIYVGNSLIDMYCKCGVVEKALVVFHEMKKKDSVSWTSLISGLAVNGSWRSEVMLLKNTYIGILERINFDRAAHPA
ncbi:hypothetical protein Patl1_20045 [Pistacia atlantica]|uniref:Uncharacterized protein n=1 Tax=Pistacia atlantica TaxID=434234 RepID=A0ACC1BKN7_9ROSI|nr:hypothetical protein Patl1_20045 [Pistacia atlantica]